MEWSVFSKFPEVGLIFLTEHALLKTAEKGKILHERKCQMRGLLLDGPINIIDVDKKLHLHQKGARWPGG